MPPTPKLRRWVVLDDSGYDDCRIASFVQKNEAVSCAKERLNSVHYRYDCVRIICTSDRNKDVTFYRTPEQKQRFLDFEAAEQARYDQIRAERERDLTAGFHWKYGWFFKRMDDGAVRITRVGDHGEIQKRIEIPENEWASIVCSVSADGETADRWMAARRFHGLESK